MYMFARITILFALSALLLPAPAWAGGFKLNGLFKMSHDDEARIGAKMLEDFRKEPGVHAPDSQALNNRIVQNMGRKLVSMNKDQLADEDFEYQFFVIKDEKVNAFATPGGYIYVTEGLLDVMAYDRSMVAGVVAHEMGHVLKHHVADGYEKAMQGSAGLTLLGVLLGNKNRDALSLLESVGGVVYLKFNRDQEEEADRLGVSLSYQAGYDPFGMMRSLQCLQAMYGSADDVGEWLQDHPATEDRVERTEYIAQESSGHENGYWPIPAPPSKDHPLFELYGKQDAAGSGEVTKSTSPAKGDKSTSDRNVSYKGNVGLINRHEIWLVEEPPASQPENDNIAEPPANEPPPADEPGLEAPRNQG